MVILDDAIECWNVDGSPNADGNITWYTWLKVMIGPQPFYIKFNIANLGQERIILGNTWLQENDPHIIWSTRRLIILWKRLHRHHFGKEGLRQFMRRCWDLEALNKPLVPKIAKLTMVTKLAMKAHEKQTAYTDACKNIPSKYHAFLDVFQDFPGKKLPPRWQYDHAIDLNPDFIPQKSAPYSLSPAQMLALDKFLDENLAKGFIHPSKSPQATPLFFIPKKNNKQQACMDYRYLNSATIRNSYPLPQAKDLMNKIGNAKVFTKLDLRNGYYNIQMKQGDEAKAAFMNH